MPLRPSALGLALGALAACGGPAPPRISVPPIQAGERVGIGFASVEVVEASLPAYADGEEVFVQGDGGALAPGEAVWADDPSRALTLDLSQALSDLTGARVAPEPWPFDEAAEARLDVRVAEFAVDGAQGAFVLRGQYFVGAFDESGRDRVRDFSILAPLPKGFGPADIAAARADATARLAREVAGEGLR